jgi:hypothetical protein
MHASSGGRKDETWLMHPNQACDCESRLRSIANQPIIEREQCSSNTEYGGSLFGLALSDPPNCVTRRLAVTEVDEQHGQPAAHELRGGATQNDFQIVRVGSEGDNVVLFWSGFVVHRGTPIQGCKQPPVGDS